MQGQFGGFYVIGPKRSSDPYFTEDIDLITAVASQVGIASRLHVQIGLAEAEKRRAERMVSFGALARGLAHEIKNPLVAIRTFAELLPERAGDEEFRDSFGKIVIQEIGRIDQLVARLRGFAAPPIPRFRPVDITSLLRETLALLRGEIERAKVRIAVTGERSAQEIPGDPAQLKSLFLNILMNALEAIDMAGRFRFGFHSSWMIGLPSKSWTLDQESPLNCFPRSLTPSSLPSQKVRGSAWPSAVLSLTLIARQFAQRTTPPDQG